MHPSEFYAPRQLNPFDSGVKCLELVYLLKGLDFDILPKYQEFAGVHHEAMIDAAKGAGGSPRFFEYIDELTSITLVHSAEGEYEVVVEVDADSVYLWSPLKATVVRMIKEKFLNRWRRYNQFGIEFDLPLYNPEDFQAESVAHVIIDEETDCHSLNQLIAALNHHGLRFVVCHGSTLSYDGAYFHDMAGIIDDDKCLFLCDVRKFPSYVRGLDVLHNSPAIVERCNDVDIFKMFNGDAVFYGDGKINDWRRNKTNLSNNGIISYNGQRDYLFNAISGEFFLVEGAVFGADGKLSNIGPFESVLNFMNDTGLSHLYLQIDGGRLLNLNYNLNFVFYHEVDEWLPLLVGERKGRY